MVLRAVRGSCQPLAVGRVVARPAARGSDVLGLTAMRLSGDNLFTGRGSPPEAARASDGKRHCPYVDRRTGGWWRVDVAQPPTAMRAAQQTSSFGFPAAFGPDPEPAGGAETRAGLGGHADRRPAVARMRGARWR